MIRMIKEWRKYILMPYQTLFVHQHTNFVTQKTICVARQIMSRETMLHFYGCLALYFNNLISRDHWWYHFMVLSLHNSILMVQRDRQDMILWYLAVILDFLTFRHCRHLLLRYLAIFICDNIIPSTHYGLNYLVTPDWIFLNFRSSYFLLK